MIEMIQTKKKPMRFVDLKKKNEQSQQSAYKKKVAHLEQTA